MDGARVVRIEIDKDEDGKIDRWEYYDANQKLEKIGSSRAQRRQGRLVVVSPAPDGTIDAHRRLRRSTTARSIASSTTRTTCWSRAEEDTDGDGKMDKWETYDGDRLASVAFDTHAPRHARPSADLRRRRHARDSKSMPRATATSWPST